MKRIILFFCAVSAFFSVYAQKTSSTAGITDELLSEIDHVSPPKIVKNYIVFTAEPTAHFVGIAFDFENFIKIHPFKLRTFADTGDEKKESCFFYLLDIPKDKKSISYRLIIDGLWTTDPLNSNSEYNPETGIKLSKIDIKKDEVPSTVIESGNTVHFIYKGQSGQLIRLGGSFTNWDSWIYTMSEIEPGVYSLDLPLPEGTYYYSFYSGLNRIIDATNPLRAYTVDGRIASVLQVTYQKNY